MSRTVTSAAPIGSELESASGWVRPILREMSMIWTRPALALPLPIWSDIQTGIELIERASAELSGMLPEKERP